jgi:dephospho-CoA kinase
VKVVGVYVVTRDKSMRQRLAEHSQMLDEREKSLGFDPIGNPEDRKRLQSWVD